MPSDSAMVVCVEMDFCVLRSDDFGLGYAYVDYERGGS